MAKIIHSEPFIALRTKPYNHRDSFSNSYEVCIGGEEIVYS